MPPGSRTSAIQEQAISSTGSPPSLSTSARQTPGSSHADTNGIASRMSGKSKSASTADRPAGPARKSIHAHPPESTKRAHSDEDDDRASSSKKSLKSTEGPSASTVNGKASTKGVTVASSPSKGLLFRTPVDQPAAQVNASDADPAKECGKIVTVDLTKYPVYERMQHRPHDCSSSCLFKESHRGLMEYSKVVHSPLVIPLLFGWTREIVKVRPSKQDLREKKFNYRVVYHSPCGTTIRNEAKLSAYLVTVQSILSRTVFSFRPDMDISRKLVIGKSTVKKYQEDIAKGQILPARIPMVNCFSEKVPDAFNYYKKCVKSEGVVKLMEKLNVTDRSTGCECVGSCEAGCLCVSMMEEEYNSGYRAERLTERTLYVVECNEHCKCGPNCGNRVTTSTVQFPMLLYYYPTKGWGVRALCDIPTGTFMGFYLGKFIIDSEIMENNDKYLVALDYEKTVGGTIITNPDGSISNSTVVSNAEEEMVNIDGRQFGNVSRFFNHSCDPNLFAQNIHKEMFSSRVYNIGFFTKKDVKAGDELCWDYAYVKDSIAGRRIKCMCGAAICRKFML